MASITGKPGMWGHRDLRLEEYFLETSWIDSDGWIIVLRDIGYTGHLTIEREVGEDPVRDIT